MSPSRRRRPKKVPSRRGSAAGSSQGKRPGRSGRKDREEGKGREVAAGSAREDSRRDFLWALLLTLLAWLHRIFFIASNNDRALPFTGFYHGDSETFFRYARAILAGQPYDSGIPFHPPGFAYFLAGLHWLLGAGEPSATVPHLKVKIALALVSALSVGLLYLLARPYVGRTVALFAAGLCTLHFGLFILATAPVTEGLFLTLMLLCLLVWSRKLEHPLAAPARSPRRWQPLWGSVLGLLLGALVLVRAEAQLLVLLLVGAGASGAFWEGPAGERGKGAAGAGDAGTGAVRPATGRVQGTSRSLLPWALLLLAFAACLTPWALRNHRHLEELNDRLGSRLEEPLPTFVPLTLYGPLNLALANHEASDGTFSRDVMSSARESGRLDVTDPQHLAFLLHGDELAWAFMREQPAAYGRLVLKKWRLYFESAKLGFTQWNVPGGLSGLRRPIDVFVPYSGAALWWILPGALLGLAFCLLRGGPERRWGLLVLLLTGGSLMVTALFFGYSRQGLLMLPFWLSLDAAALAGLLSALASRLGHPPLPREPSRRLLKVLAALCLAFLLVEAWGSTRDRRYQATGTTLPGKRFLNPDLTVYLRPLPDAEPARR